MSYVRKRYRKVVRRHVPMGGLAQSIQTIAAITGIAADATYLRSNEANRRVPAPAAMGDASSVISSIVNAAGVASDVATDPYLPETMCRIAQIKALNNGAKPGACTSTPLNLKGGAGLRKFIQPLRAYVYAEQHPWAYALAVAGVVGVPLLIGFALGRREHH